MPGDSRALIGFLTFNKSVNFYNLRVSMFILLRRHTIVYMYLTQKSDSFIQCNIVGFQFINSYNVSGPCIFCNQVSMDDLHDRLNFYVDRKNKIFHHILQGHLKISKTAKFGCKML